ncbi:MAG TPA: hypothetical protein VF985_02170 [Mariniflexile sp.]
MQKAKNLNAIPSYVYIMRSYNTAPSPTASPNLPAGRQGCSYNCHYVKYPLPAAQF